MEGEVPDEVDMDELGQGRMYVVGEVWEGECHIDTWDGMFSSTTLKIRWRSNEDEGGSMT